MRDREENNQIHQFDFACNSEVAELITTMKVLKNPRDCIDYLANGKSKEELKKYCEMKNKI